MQFEEKEYRMDFEKIILNTLLDKYEASKALYETGYNIENYDRKQIIHDVIFELKKAGIIDFSWQKYEKRKHNRRNLVK